MLPTLPPEVIFAIIREVAVALPMSDFQERSSTLRTLSLVSKAWTIEAQSHLFEQIDSEPLGSLNDLLHTLRARSHLRPFVKSITVQPIDKVLSSNEPGLLLDSLDLLPALRTLDGFCWPCDSEEAPPATRARPALESLRVYLPNEDPSPRLLRDWFNLKSLKRLIIEPRDEGFNFARFESLPRGLEELQLLGFFSEDFPDFERYRIHLKNLESLVLVPDTLVSVEDGNPVALLPNLRSLHLQGAHGLVLLLSVANSHLERLVVGANLSSDELEEHAFPDGHPLRLFVAEVCRLVKVVPARFPALREIGLLGDYYWPVAFTRPDSRWVPGVREMARDLRAVGLTVADRHGDCWQDEWFDEERPSPA